MAGKAAALSSDPALSSPSFEVSLAPVNSLLITLIGALVSTNPPAALADAIEAATGKVAKAPGQLTVADLELKRIEAADDEAQAEVDEWIRNHHAFTAQGAGVSDAELNERIRKRFAAVRAGYEDFIRRHPDHAEARLAYASFLSDMGEEEAEVIQLEKARELDPTKPAVWNNLANYFGHRGSPKKAFEYYEKAIELDPDESLYYHNFGTTVYLFRKDVKEHYGIEEQQVFDKAMNLYSNAMRLDPKSFPLATDVAQTYYGIRPWRVEDALKSWTNAFSLARDDIEREGVHVHFARIKMNAGRYEESQAHLDSITNAMYGDIKARLLRNLGERRAGSTNSVDNAAEAETP